MNNEKFGSRIQLKNNRFIQLTLYEERCYSVIYSIIFNPSQ